ncbi:hypothetical protein L6452_41878 [Arctium lappa]|uniref:Uncharacterized protein n=1 Tax=Arctium lappa TaxID=4217 RepID=A0ACB8XIH5_ARCLA|nr:hypothetical protein L6452_41878 [Arctium lappa]
MTPKDSKLKNLVVSDHYNSSCDQEHDHKETRIDIGLSFDKLNLGHKKKLLGIPLGGMIVHQAHRLRPTTIPRNHPPDFSFGNFFGSASSAAVSTVEEDGSATVVTAGEFWCSL